MHICYDLQTSALTFSSCPGVLLNSLARIFCKPEGKYCYRMPIGREYPRKPSPFPSLLLIGPVFTQKLRIKVILAVL